MNHINEHDTLNQNTWRLSIIVIGASDATLRQLSVKNMYYIFSRTITHKNDKMLLSQE